MWTLLFALLCALFLSRRFEGTIRVRGMLASCAFYRLGRVRLFAYAWRPGRMYVRLEVMPRGA